MHHRTAGLMTLLLIVTVLMFVPVFVLFFYISTMQWRPDQEQRFIVFWSQTT